MTIFEHVMVLLSLILSLGIASLLIGVARLAQEWRRVVFSWPHALWTVLIFFNQILFWLYAFTFRHLPQTSLVGVALALGLVISVFLQGALVTPYIHDEGPIDLKAFHQSHRFQYLGAIVVYELLVLAYSAHISTLMTISVLSFVVPAYLIVTALPEIFFRAPWVQVACALLQLASALTAFAQLVASFNRGA
ncbi:MAG: hypothetical protein JOZ72_11695 [Alphaproteobacteria bacterium]|nr:hypothetical protein [Alphaproteobacteria bacterium]